MSLRIPATLAATAAAAVSLALPSGALAGISIPLPPPSATLTAERDEQRKIVPVVAGNGKLYLCDDVTWECIPW